MRITPLVILATLLLAGCSDSEPEVYEVPKEETPSPPQQQAPFAPFAEGSMPTQPQGSGDMASQQLPDSAINQSSANPDWVVPDSWTPAEGSSMRRASFAAPGQAGPADVSVTSFPGDVGGLLANINRWRNQIGLGPVSQTALEEQIETLTAGPHQGVFVELQNNDQATLAVIFDHQGNSWFFKMTGPTLTVEKNSAAFREFVESVRF